MSASKRARADTGSEATTSKILKLDLTEDAVQSVEALKRKVRLAFDDGPSSSRLSNERKTITKPLMEMEVIQ